MKEQLKQNIEKMKRELAEMEAELEKSGKVEKVELRCGEYNIFSDGTFSSSGATTLSQINSGATRATKELAEISSKNMVARNKLEAYAMQLEPEWKDVGQYAYHIVNICNTYKWAETYNGARAVGCVYMSKQTAETLCQWLNEGRITLDKE